MYSQTLDLCPELAMPAGKEGKQNKLTLFFSPLRHLDFSNPSCFISNLKYLNRQFQKIDYLDFFGIVLRRELVCHSLLHHT